MAELYRYAAFISYSSKDASFARRLHRALERYGIPSSLGKFDLIGGGKRNRIYPVFRDREELAAGHLGDVIEANLRASAALIVVCSPNAAASPWVQKEIEYFANLGRQNKIFAIVAEDAPLVDAGGADATALCFPPAFRGDALVGDNLEPLAADARKGKDGFRNAWLKIVAGLIGVGPGQMVDRDRRRRVERAVFNTVAVSVTVFAVGFLFATQNKWRPVVDAAMGRYVYYDVLLPQSVREGIEINSRVMFNGIDVGAVEGIRLSTNDMHVSVARVVMSGDVPIRADSTAEIRSTPGGQGRLYIAITTGSVEHPLLPGSDGRSRPPRLVAIFGDNAAALMDRAAIYASEDDRAHAIADYSEAIRRSPELASAYHARALVYSRAGDVAAAAADDNRAIALDPTNRTFLVSGCRSNAVWGEQLGQALAYCDAALRARPDHPDTLNNRGLVHLRRGDFQAAFADYDASVRGDANLIDSLYGRGIARLRLGQTAEGRADIAAATTRDANVAAAFAGYGVTP